MGGLRERKLKCRIFHRRTRLTQFEPKTMLEKKKGKKRVKEKVKVNNLTRSTLE